MSDLNRAEIARSQLIYDASRKSVGVAYLLLIFLGGFGAHRFYLGSTGSAVAMLLLNFVGWMTVWMGVGLVVLGFAWLWLFVDLFLLPGIARRYNMRLANDLTGGIPATI
ncbi:TM2 domain-containing membrane protein YozV [Sphingomonas sp. SORGH_AS870]|uniref:TM2 domain-containing protein n=1 Tax=Sphingomonas sp. SORGH_AS_0870 TaxID=3041801 RepID=UPI00285829EA|nr:TM2 domain-containing protein [Sphingomonas sp. SORGH_AS_0870]MDR6147532.1 TM2 domain-containing membrane protein YozV [Sphingomonas sp. SORGH_AS_0870]